MSPDETPAGVIAEFDGDEALVAALRAAKAEGWVRMEAFGPFPVAEAEALLGARGWPVAAIALGAGLFGGALQYGMQYWMNVVDYPLNIGGRPPHALPAFLPATLIVGILWSAAATLIGMLALNRLPRLHHPVFAVPGFDRASQDRFFLMLHAEDPRFAPDAATRFLRTLSPLRITAVPRGEAAAEGPRT